MVKLELEVVISNLNKIKTSLEKSFEKIGAKGKGGGGAGAVAIGGAVAIFTKLLSSVDSVVKLLEIIGSLINQLVAPFVPLLLGLIKPVFVLLQKFLFGAMQSLGVGGFGDSGIDVGFGETIVKLILSTLAGALGTVASVIGGLSVGWALAIGSALFLIIPHLVDFGKSLGDKLLNVGAMIGDFIANGLTSISQIVFDVFNIDLLTPLQSIFSNIIGIFDGLINIVVGIFSLDWEMIKTGFKDVFSNIWELLQTVLIGAISNLWEILKTAWEGITSIWEWLLESMSSAISSFANLFIDGLNALISLLNKIPGVDIDKVKSVGSKDINTSININVEGNTNDDTIETMIKQLRKEQKKSGIGSF